MQCWVSCVCIRLQPEKLKPPPTSRTNLDPTWLLAACLHSAPASSLPCQLPFLTEQLLFSKAFHSHGRCRNHFPKFSFISFYFLLLLL